ncbi:MAG: phenylalanine--tRNA ligase subunit alpha [Candidatus Omnitrophica bacterium]|nr:phenylalanine--tRNA ligase subunit alpha [Candidatus Omnitrophota bacterium]
MGSEAPLEQELEALLEEARKGFSEASSALGLEELRTKYLGRHGALSGYFPRLKEPGLAPEEKARLGRKLNQVKEELETLLARRRSSLASTAAPVSSGEDLTLPGTPPAVGRLHPLTQTIGEIIRIFRLLGFSVVEGPEVETERYNFEALNIPVEHPSRENFDTFYLETPKPFLLRSHTSPVQIRFMETHKPPFQIVVPGRVFRPDAVDASHSFQFHQVEGLCVAPGVTFGDLKGVLTAWAQGMFGEMSRLRFRPHFFPFTEPSAEADLSCTLCQAKGCRVCGGKGWLEILGCGMVHPAVFRAVGYPKQTVGFAFGMGVERIAMLKHGVEDIRLFFENDLRFLQQFP